jgi:hypothetical protein
MARLGLIPLPVDGAARAALVQILNVVTIGAPLLGVLVVKYLRTIPGWESSLKYLMGRQILELLYPEFHILYVAVPLGQRAAAAAAVNAFRAANATIPAALL